MVHSMATTDQLEASLQVSTATILISTEEMVTAVLVETAVHSPER